ncbi:aconitase family protein [Patescibacteria group bacterium]
MLKTYAQGFPLKDPESIILIADHFVCSPDKKVRRLLKMQENFAKKHKTVFYKNKASQAQGICHTLMMESHLLPGQLAAGTDSHSSMWGALGALAIPVGATAMANAFLTKEILLTVPETIKIGFVGELAKNCSARDVILYLMTFLPLSKVMGKIIEYDIKKLNWPVDELSVLTNQAKEMGALSAIMTPNKKVIDYLCKQRKLTKKQIEKLIIKSDTKAVYAGDFLIDLNKVKAMVALPGDPKNTVNLEDLKKRPKIDKAFIGSCVGGKWEDLQTAAKILKGKKVAKGVKLIIQPASKKIIKKMKEKRLDLIFKKAGAEIIPSNCGGCIGQGLARVEKKEIGIFTSTRNYQGRSGPGQVYLASPQTVAASAIAGRICFWKEAKQ